MNRSNPFIAIAVDGFLRHNLRCCHAVVVHERARGETRGDRLLNTYGRLRDKYNPRLRSAPRAPGLVRADCDASSCARFVASAAVSRSARDRCARGAPARPRRALPRAIKSPPVEFAPHRRHRAVARPPAARLSRRRGVSRWTATIATFAAQPSSRARVAPRASATASLVLRTTVFRRLPSPAFA